MKISCTQENLNKGLLIVSHISGRNASLPILNNVLIKTENKVIKLSTTDLEIGINCIVRGKVEVDGALTVQAKLLSDYVNLLPKEKIDLEIKGEDLMVACQESKTKIKGISSEEFPLIPKIEKEETATCQSNILKQAIQQTIFSVTPNEARPEISGVLLNFNQELVLTGTDSYRLTEKKIKLEKSAVKGRKVIVPLKTLQELLRILPDEEIIVEINLSENQIMFSFDEVELISRIIDGQYPDYQQIIPTSHKTKVIVQTNEFIRTIKTASLFCRPGINNINLSFSQKNNELVTAVINNQLGENTSKTKVEIEGDDNAVIFNYRYLLEGLINFNGDEIVMEITNGDSPCLLKPINDESYLYIIMPIKQ
ncbi:MAG: DNA polymerase III subunit beta [bacterium]